MNKDFKAIAIQLGIVIPSCLLSPIDINANTQPNINLTPENKSHIASNSNEVLELLAFHHNISNNEIDLGDSHTNYHTNYGGDHTDNHSNSYHSDRHTNTNSYTKNGQCIPHSDYHTNSAPHSDSHTNNGRSSHSDYHTDRNIKTSC